MGDSLDCAVSRIAVAAQWSCTLAISTVAANMYIIFVPMMQSWQVMLMKDTSIVALNINGSAIGAERMVLFFPGNSENRNGEYSIIWYFYYTF